MSDPTSIIFDIRRYSIHDGPGIRTTVFLKGCGMGCRWCHNPESQRREPELIFHETRCIHCGECLKACPQQAITFQNDLPTTDPTACTHCGTCTSACPTQARELIGRVWTVPEVMAIIRRDIAFYDESGGGVTLSGGEPLDQPAFTAALLCACKAEDIHTALDTSGYGQWEILDDLSPDVDLFLYDVKIMDDALHRQFTGVSNQLILENLRRLAESGHKLILRVPLIPGITDGEENLRAVAQLAQSLPNILRVDLLPYHDTARQKYQRMGLEYPLAAGDSMDLGKAVENLASQVELLQSYQIETRIGG
jgi:pyruvate formate lyase activating enzyme